MSQVVQYIKVKELQADPHQPRKSFNDAALAALGESMKVRQLHPLLVRADGEDLIIVDGERRWRAAKLANIKELACIMSNAAGLDIALDQVATSAQREGLSAIELAEFLVDLQTREHRTTNDLLAALASRGIRDLGAVKMAKLMQLAQLPDWAKKYARSGKLTDAQAAALLPIAKHRKLADFVKKEVDDVLRWQGGMTTSDLDDAIRQAPYQTGIDLNIEHGDRVRHFDIAVCKGCEHYLKLSKREFCFSPEEFKRKNDDAIALQKSTGMAGKLTRKQKAEQTQKQNARDESRLAGRRDRHRELLEKFLRAAVQKHIAFVDPTKLRGLRLWLALGAPIGRSWVGRLEQLHEQSARTVTGPAISWKISTLDDCLRVAQEWNAEKLVELSKAAVRVMPREVLRKFARDTLELTLDYAGFRITADYLKLKRKGELMEIAAAAFGSANPVKNMKLGEVTAALLEPGVVERLGVPADIAAYYAEPYLLLTDSDGEELEDGDAEPVCIECGCAMMDACEGGCSWVDLDDTGVVMRGDKIVEGSVVGICSACPQARWDSGDRELSEKALDRIRERERGAWQGVEAPESAQALEDQIAAALPAAGKKKRKAARA